jgi:hypothetical protein
MRTVNTTRQEFLMQRWHVALEISGICRGMKVDFYIFHAIGDRLTHKICIGLGNPGTNMVFGRP